MDLKAINSLNAAQSKKVKMATVTVFLTIDSKRRKARCGFSHDGLQSIHSGFETY